MIYVVARIFNAYDELAGYKLVDSETKEIRDVSCDNLLKVLSDGKAKVENVTVIDNKLVGTQGTLDRYPTNIISNKIKSTVIIINEIVDKGEVVAFRTVYRNGKIHLQTYEAVLEYGNRDGIANADIVRNGLDIKIVPIVGTRFRQENLTDLNENIEWHETHWSQEKRAREFYKAKLNDITYVIQEMLKRTQNMTICTEMDEMDLAIMCGIYYGLGGKKEHVKYVDWSQSEVGACTAAIVMYKNTIEQKSIEPMYEVDLLNDCFQRFIESRPITMEDDVALSKEDSDVLSILRSNLVGKEEKKKLEDIALYNIAVCSGSYYASIPVKYDGFNDSLLIDVACCVVKASGYMGVDGPRINMLKARLSELWRQFRL